MEINLNEIFEAHPEVLLEAKAQLKKHLIAFLAREVLNETITPEDVAEEVVKQMMDDVVVLASDKVVEDFDAEGCVEQVVDNLELESVVSDKVTEAIENEIDLGEIVLEYVTQKIRENFDS